MLLGMIAGGLAGTFPASAHGPQEIAPSNYDTYPNNNGYYPPGTYSRSYTPRYDGAYRYGEHQAFHEDLKMSHEELHWSIQDAVRELDRDIRRQHEALHRRFAIERAQGVPERQIKAEHEAAHRELNRARAAGRAAIREAHLRSHDIIRNEHLAEHESLRR